MRQKIADSLRQLGLTENEASVYLALINHSPCFVAPLVQATRKHRQMVYNALETLSERNLVSRSLKNGKYQYELSDPNRFLLMIHEQEEVAQEVIASIQSKISSSSEQVESFRGIDGYKRAITELLGLAERHNEYLVLNSNSKEFTRITAPFQKDFLARLRKVKKTGGKVEVLVYPDNVADSRNQELHGQFFGDPFDTKVVDQPTPPQTIWISGDSVYLRNRLADPLVIHLRSVDLAKRYREYFYTLWSRAKNLE
jgi:sugar-specific transcriptional regulator TrmB